VNEIVALGWVYVACALWRGSDRPRGVARWTLLQPLGRARAAQAAAAALIIAAAARWNASEPGPAAFIAVPMALLACGTAVALLGAVFPRGLWASALVALPASIGLALLGGAHG
jgi:hypothetical protein